MHVQILFDGTVVRGKLLKIVYALENMYKMPKYVIFCKKLFTRNLSLKKDNSITKN